MPLIHSKTISSRIMGVLKANRKWWLRQDLEDKVHAKYRTLHASVGRIARELFSEDKIERDYKKVPRVRGLTMYRYKTKKV